MVGEFKESLESQRSTSIFHYVGVISNFLHDLQQTKKGLVAQRKTIPGGIFCMSGPVAHADDDDDDDDEDDKDNGRDEDVDKHCHYAHIQKVLHSQDPCKSCVSPDKQDLTFLCTKKWLHTGNICVRSPQQQFSESTANHVRLNRCFFESNWSSKSKNGRGKIYWSSGSSYEGEVMGSNLHGLGTYKSVDGANYKGHWILNKKHGFGKKWYANGDLYEGLWKCDVPDGQGRYFWNNGSEYSGDWRNGMMSGRGVLLWANGDMYDGQWLNGLRDGRGIYTWADGSSYVGAWKRGLKSGTGSIYPPGSKPVKMNTLEKIHPHHRESQVSENKPNAYQMCRSQKQYSTSDTLQVHRRSGHRSSADKLTLRMLSSALENGLENSLFLKTLWRSEGTPSRISRSHEEETLSNSNGQTVEINKNHGKEQDIVLVPALESEIIEGAPLRESAEKTLCSSSGRLVRQRQRLIMQEPKRPGQTIYKGHGSYDLMLNLQLGISFSVGKVVTEQERNLFPLDFSSKATISVNFPREGSQLTMPHQSVDFKWKDYCPMVFRHLREMFKIDSTEYMLSMCASDGLRELSSLGKSGSVFYLSQDERFMIKTLRKAEVKVLLGMLPKYYNHVRMHENTLLTKFFGLHQVKPMGGQKVRFIVMGNVVSTDSWIHKRFDLKGSSQGRSTGKLGTDSNATLKDLDLDLMFYLEPALHDAVLEQMFRDCRFLEAEHIMDYSLLLGLHFKGPHVPSASSMDNGTLVDLPVHKAVVSRFLANNVGLVEEGVASKCVVSLSEDLQQDSTTGSPSSLKQAAARDPGELQITASKRYSTGFGANMPAKAWRRLWKNKDNLQFREVYDVVLYFGIIDILQEYDMGKKLEHAYKSIQFDSLSISAVDPGLYARRFLQFMHHIFPANP